MSSNDPMIYNFSMLKERIKDTLTNTNVNTQLKKVKGPTICVGSGGSKVVAAFSSLVLNHKNNCLCKVLEPRDALYENVKSYNNLFICSYSGTNHGVDCLKNLKTKKYLLTYAKEEQPHFKNLRCSSTLDKEMSFISLAATIMPMSILLSYYLNYDATELIMDMLNIIEKTEFKINNNLSFELMSGQDTISSEIYLESTFAESGLSNLIVHHKYDYCHGRSTLNFKQKKNLIYLINQRNTLDDLLLEELQTRYETITVLESPYSDPIINDFYLTLLSLYLTKYLSTLNNIDLSIVEYDKPLCKKLYKYRGEM